MARILIIDDSPVHLQMMHDIIVGYAAKDYKSDWQLKITLLSDAATALQTVQENNYELIIVDVVMARMDGWEFIKQVRQKYPDFNVPIIVVSAVEGVDLEYQSMRHGASAWFSKPFSPKKFAQGVFSLLSEG